MDEARKDRIDRIIVKVNELSDEELSILLSRFGHCQRCGTPIYLNIGKRKFCKHCAEEVNSAKHKEWYRKNYASLKWKQYTKGL